MSFFVNETKPKDVRIFLKQEGHKVHIMGEDHNDRTWIIFTLLNDGTFRRPDCINRNIGITVDSNGRIKESK